MSEEVGCYICDKTYVTKAVLNTNPNPDWLILNICDTCIRDSDLERKIKEKTNP